MFPAPIAPTLSTAPETLGLQLHCLEITAKSVICDTFPMPGAGFRSVLPIALTAKTVTMRESMTSMTGSKYWKIGDSYKHGRPDSAQYTHDQITASIWNHIK